MRVPSPPPVSAPGVRRPAWAGSLLKIMPWGGTLEAVLSGVTGAPVPPGIWPAAHTGSCEGVHRKSPGQTHAPCLWEGWGLGLHPGPTL